MSFPECPSRERTARLVRRIREAILEYPDVGYVIVLNGRNDSGTDPFPPSRQEVLVGPRKNQEWTQTRKRALVTAISARLHEEFPTTRWAFTQPILDSVTEDTNGTSADPPVEFSGSAPTVPL